MLFVLLVFLLAIGLSEYLARYVLIDFRIRRSLLTRDRFYLSSLDAVSYLPSDHAWTSHQFAFCSHISVAFLVDDENSPTVNDCLKTRTCLDHRGDHRRETEERFRTNRPKQKHAFASPKRGFARGASARRETSATLSTSMKSGFYAVEFSSHPSGGTALSDTRTCSATSCSRRTWASDSTRPPRLATKDTNE